MTDGSRSGISGDFAVGLHSLHRKGIGGLAITPFHTYEGATLESIRSDFNKAEVIFTLQTYLKVINQRSVSAYNSLDVTVGSPGRMVFFIQANSNSESTLLEDIQDIKDQITAVCLSLGFDEENFTFCVMIPAAVSEFDEELVSQRQTIADAIIEDQTSVGNTVFVNIPAIFSYREMIDNGWATVSELAPSSFTGGQCCDVFEYCVRWSDSDPTLCLDFRRRWTCWDCDGPGPTLVCGVIEAGGPGTGGSSSSTSEGESSSSSSNEKFPFI
jgi:hypothetical protein